MWKEMSWYDEDDGNAIISRSLAEVTSEKWFLPVIILAILFNTPPIFYVMYLIFQRLKLMYDEIPYSANSYKSTSLTMFCPSRMCDASYRYKRYLTIINNMDGWCEFDFKWKYRNLNFMIEITYASTEKRPVNLLVNGRLLGQACGEVSTGWGWNNLESEFKVVSYGPYNTVMLDVNTLRIESTANRFPHIKQVRVLLPKKQIGVKVTASILAHIENEGDCEFPDGHTAISKAIGNRLGGFAVNPMFPIGAHVAVKYSVLMDGGVFTGAVTQGEFCGNRGSYMNGWRDLQVIRIWLDGADSDKYSIYYRCLVRGSSEPSDWCSNGEECPCAGNTAAITGLSVLIEERGAGNLALVDFARDIEAPQEGYITADVISNTRIRTGRSGVGFVTPAADAKIQYTLIKPDANDAHNSLLRVTFCNVVYIALLAKFEDAQDDTPCAFGAFSVNPKFPSRSHVAVAYSAQMSGDVNTGPVSQGIFCGNSGSYIYGWRDLQVVRIWLDGADSDKYSIYYRCLVRGSSEPSDWCSNGEECPCAGNTAAIVGLSVVVLAGAGHKDHMDEICAQLEEGVMSSVGLLSSTNKQYVMPTQRKQKKRKLRAAAKIAPSVAAADSEGVKADEEMIMEDGYTEPHLLDWAMGCTEEDSSRTALALMNTPQEEEKQEETVHPFYARLAYLKECIKYDSMPKALAMRNIDALYSGRPHMVPLTLTTYFDIKGEKSVMGGTMAVSGNSRHALFAFMLRPLFPPEHEVTIKSRADMRGGLSSAVATPGNYCGNKSDSLHGWRDLHVIRIWLDGADSDKYTVYYRCLYKGASEPSPWRKNGEVCPHVGSVAPIEGLCVIIEENDAIEIPEAISIQRRGGEAGRCGVGESLGTPSQSHNRTVLPKLKATVSPMKKQRAVQTNGKSRHEAETRQKLGELKQQLVDGVITRDVYMEIIKTVLGSVDGDD
jgi:hypothetical protein